MTTLLFHTNQPVTNYLLLFLFWLMLLIHLLNVDFYLLVLNLFTKKYESKINIQKKKQDVKMKMKTVGKRKTQFAHLTLRHTTYLLLLRRPRRHLLLCCCLFAVFVVFLMQHQDLIQCLFVTVMVLFVTIEFDFDRRTIHHVFLFF